MERGRRIAYATLGSLGIVATLVGLTSTFCGALYPLSSDSDVIARVRHFATMMTGYYPTYIGTAFGLVVLHASAFLCVKAVYGPRHFWSHTRRHLLMTTGIAWVLAFLPFTWTILLPL